MAVHVQKPVKKWRGKSRFWISQTQHYLNIMIRYNQTHPDDHYLAPGDVVIINSILAKLSLMLVEKTAP